MDLTLRACRPDDFESVYRMICILENQTMNRKGMEEVFLNALNRSDRYYLIALSDGLPAGFGSLHLQGLLHHAGISAEIEELVVLPEFRNQKIGSHLYQALYKIAREKQAAVFEVASNRIRNDAHRFYESQGLKKSHYKFTEEFR
jgi:PhnO protein